MSYTAEVAFHPASELLNSLHTYLCKTFYKRVDLGPTWAEETELKLSPAFAATLQQTVLSAEWKLLYLYLYLCPKKETALDFLGWLDALTAGDLYELASPYVGTFPGSMGEVRDRLVFLLSEWNRQYFAAAVGPELLGFLEEDARTKQAWIGTAGGPELAERITNGLYFDPRGEYDHMVLTPQYHFQPANITYVFGRLLVCQYAVDGSHNETPGEPSRRLYRQLRSLSEKSRLRMLRYLYSQPRNFTEIVRHIGISKGITHDHIFNLRSAGLLRVHMQGETASAYSLRVEAVRHLERDLLDFLLAE